MTNNQLTLRFTGVADLKPQNLRAKELALIIDTLETAIVAAVIAQDPSLKREQVAVPLVAITDESIGLAFTPNLPPLTYPAAARIAQALASERFLGRPEPGLEPLGILVRSVHQRGCIAEVTVTQGGKSVTASLTPTTRITAYTPVDGETVIYGEVIRAGGVEPKVELKPLAGKTLFCPTSQEIAVQLAGRLYQQVGVFGYATWDRETLEIKEFHISRVLPYQKRPLTQAFQLLRESAHGAFDSIEDVEEYVTTIRTDEDTD